MSEDEIYLTKTNLWQFVLLRKCKFVDVYRKVFGGEGRAFLYLDLNPVPVIYHSEIAFLC